MFKSIKEQLEILKEQALRDRSDLDFHIIKSGFGSLDIEVIGNRIIDYVLGNCYFELIVTENKKLVFCITDIEKTSFTVFSIKDILSLIKKVKQKTIKELVLIEMLSKLCIREVVEL